MWRDGRCGRLRLSADSVSSVPSDASAKLSRVAPRIALSFDDGPSQRDMRELSDAEILAELQSGGTNGS